ncbi:hypothetical protein JCM10908_000034 [Rhodotorula pacifica]|uniref:uncharacterized protein n=1 Tax=Rhodotorula pacifica TaxID=1495444 RepID=UPI00317574E8
MSSHFAHDQAALMARLAQVGPDENPYLVARSFLRDQLIPDASPSTLYQLYAIAGILGICGLNVLASLIWRARKGAFWLFTLQQTPRLLRPHVVTTWSCIAVLLVIFLEVFVALTIQYLHKTYYGGYFYFLFTVWFFAFWGAETAAWALGVSYIVHQRATTSAQGGVWPVYAANILGPGIPLVYSAILLSFAVPGGMSYSHAIATARSIESRLVDQAQTWQPGQAFSTTSVAWAIPQMQRLADEIGDFLGSFRSVFIFYAVTAGLLILNLGFTLVLFMFLGMSVFAWAVLAVLSPSPVRDYPMHTGVLLLLPLYAFSIIGLSCSILLLHATYLVSPSDPTAAHRSGAMNSSQHGTSCLRSIINRHSHSRDEPPRDGIRRQPDFGPNCSQVGGVVPTMKTVLGLRPHPGKRRALDDAAALSAISFKVDVEVAIDENTDYRVEHILPQRRPTEVPAGTHCL